jgi:hypothetical protein
MVEPRAAAMRESVSRLAVRSPRSIMDRKDTEMSALFAISPWVMGGPRRSTRNERMR